MIDAISSTENWAALVEDLGFSFRERLHRPTGRVGFGRGQVAACAEPRRGGVGAVGLVDLPALERAHGAQLGGFGCFAEVGQRDQQLGQLAVGQGVRVEAS
jgi:hypothetical protein